MSVVDPRETDSRNHSTDGIRLAQCEDALKRIRRIARSLADNDKALTDGQRSVIREIDAICDGALE